MVDRKFYIDSDSIPHRILAHTSGTDTLTLQTAYTGSATSGPFTIFQDEVDTGLTDILAFPVLSELQWGEPVLVVPEGELASNYPRNTIGQDVVRYAAFLTTSVVRLVPWTTEAQLYELSYNRRPAALDFGGGAADTPIVPQDSRIAIAQRALMKLYNDKRDERLQIVQAEFNETLARMSATESTFGRPRLRASASGRVTV
jgi:hypothetical protein